MSQANIDSNKYSASRYPVNPLRESWVDFLNRFNWDWFATLTFKGLPKTYTAKNKVVHWLRTIEKQEKRNIGYYKAMEFTKSGIPHFHLLMGNLDGVRRDKYWGLWFEWNGRARILPYDSKLGAGFYLTKYVVKDEYTKDTNWEIRNLEYLKQLNFTWG